MNHVCAVVVTYNRLPLLQKCITALRGQSFPCDILIIDNASEDGTKEWLGTIERPDTVAIHLAENTGGAGGFNRGMREAVERGYEYVWLMDDDTIPHQDALEKLIEADARLNGEYGWLSSHALWTDGMNCKMNIQRKTPYRDISFNASIIPSQMASFVSLFLKKEQILQFGLPYSEFFIWSDDWEYTRRISRKMLCYTVSESEVTHAMKSNKPVSIAEDSPERLSRYYYFYRNDVFLYRREGFVGWLWLILKDCWHSLQVILFRNGEKISALMTIWKGFKTGLRFLPTKQLIKDDKTID